MSLSVDIQKQLGTFRLGVRFDAKEEPLALLGASGCGKSLTLRCIAGILTPDEGHIELNGRVLYDSSAKIDLAPQRRSVGYLFQQYALFPNMSVARNIGLAVRDKGDRHRVTAEKLRQFQLEAVADKRPGQLSGGQQQRTALARILASEPEAILLDEPFSALDSFLKHQLELELTETLEKFQGVVVCVSHDRGEVYRNCRQVCVMEGGCSEPVTTLDDLFHHPRTRAAAQLSGCKNFARIIPGVGQVELPQWGITLCCGRSVPDGVCEVGLRAHHLYLCRPGELNGFSCRVRRVIQDLFSTILLLSPVGAPPQAPLLRMELPRETWAAQREPDTVTVAIAPQDILFLNEGGNLNGRSGCCSDGE